MRLAALCLAVVSLCWMVTPSLAIFIVETGGLKVQFPADKKETFDMALANFGQPKYGGQLTGKLVYPAPGYTTTPVQCAPPCNYACQNFSEAQPKYELNDAKENFIMLVDRGPYDDGLTPCTFVQKVWNAQQAGAAGVVVVSHEEELLTPDAPDDETAPDYVKNITIPAGFVTKTVGDKLKSLVQKKKTIIVALDWTDLISRQPRVEWEFWTNNNDDCGNNCDLQRQFIKDLLPLSKALEEGNFTKFTPHYLVFTCPEEYINSQECESQCIHKGRYCAPDPEDDLDKGFEGKDVIKENVRQLCLYKIANQAGQPWLWWEYAAKFWEECGVSKKNFGRDCSERVFADVNGPSILNGHGLAKWRDCIDEANMDKDTTNPILEAEKKAEQGDNEDGSISIVPTIRVNGDQFRGALKAAGVMRAICSGFPLGSEPDTCNKEWVSDNECKEGGEGWEMCHSSDKVERGLTSCKNTFAGFECECGEGYLTVASDDGSSECMDVNECTSADLMARYDDCSCERCACHNTKGGFHCESNISNECSIHNGNCWEDIIDGVHYTACADLIAEYQELAAAGRADASTPLHTCECPPCFEDNGQGGCEPLCDLKDCKSDGSGCRVEGLARDKTKTSDVPVEALIAILVCVTLLVAVAAFVGYKRLKGEMHNELDNIMTHYMPLAEGKNSIGRSVSLEPNDDDVLNAGESSRQSAQQML